MTPKEKANSLINNFYNELLINDFLQSLYAAKQCAKIAVEEMIEQCKDANFGGFGLYWGDVLKEIDNI